MSLKRAVWRSTDPMTGAEKVEPVPMDAQSSTGLTIDIRSASVETEQPKKIWVNFALASMLTLTPVNLVGPIEIYGRRNGAASATLYDLFDADENFYDGFLFPDGLIVPNPDRKILFRKVLSLEGLAKRQPFLNF